MIERKDYIMYLIVCFSESLTRDSIDRECEHIMADQKAKRDGGSAQVQSSGAGP